jgi:hypothetical protein
MGDSQLGQEPAALAVGPRGYVEDRHPGEQLGGRSGTEALLKVAEARRAGGGG